MAGSAPSRGGPSGGFGTQSVPTKKPTPKYRREAVLPLIRAYKLIAVIIRMTTAATLSKIQNRSGRRAFLPARRDGMCLCKVSDILSCYESLSLVCQGREQLLVCGDNVLRKRCIDQVRRIFLAIVDGPPQKLSQSFGLALCHTRLV